MSECLGLDLLVKERLKQWPQQPPGLRMPGRGREIWMRGRPGADASTTHPFLKLTGSLRLRTLPDGLWLNFGGTIMDPFVDVLAIEACSTLPNLLDKRSRYVPSTYSMVAVCPVPWLQAPVAPDNRMPRWRAIGLIPHPPAYPIAFPVRERRVLDRLKRAHYVEFERHHMPHAHEFFAPMDTLTAEHSDKDPELAALLARASPASNFLRAL